MDSSSNGGNDTADNEHAKGNCTIGDSIGGNNNNYYLILAELNDILDHSKRLFEEVEEFAIHVNQQIQGVYSSGIFHDMPWVIGTNMQLMNISVFATNVLTQMKLSYAPVVATMVNSLTELRDNYSDVPGLGDVINQRYNQCTFLHANCMEYIDFLINLMALNYNEMNSIMSEAQSNEAQPPDSSNAA